MAATSMSSLKTRLQDSAYINLVKARLCIVLTKEGLEEFAGNESNELHRIVLANLTSIPTNPGHSLSRSCIHITRSQPKIICSDVYCQNFVTAVFQESVNPKYCHLANTDVAKWHSQPWEMAKLFMNPGQQPAQTSPCQTDLRGIINFISHCRVPRNHIYDRTLLDKVLFAGNRIMHTLNMKLSASEFNVHTKAMIDLLTDPSIKKFKSAQLAVTEIQKILGSVDFQITLEDESKVMDKLAEELHAPVLGIKADIATVAECAQEDRETLRQQLETEILKDAKVLYTRDMVSDIRNTQVQNTTQLKENTAQLEESTAQLEENIAQLKEHKAQQHENPTQMEGHKAQLHENPTQLEEITTQLEKHIAQLEGHKAQLHENPTQLEEITTQHESLLGKLSSIPAEIMRMDSKSVELYKQALDEGEEEDHTIRIMVVGHYGVGKTALTKRLLCQEVDVKERNSTDGIDVHVDRCKVSLKTNEWSVDLPDKSDEILERIVKVLGSKQNVIASGENTSSGVDEEILNTTKERISQHSDIISNATGTSDQHTHDLDTVDSLKYCTTVYERNDADINTSCSMSFSSIENEDTLMAELKEVVASSRNTEFQHDYAKISVWDFGGQFVFYSTHQMFLTHRAIYILVFNISQHIGDLVFDDEPYFDCSGLQSFKIEDFIDIWLTSIHGHSRIKGAGSTPIILVGTHTDQLSPERKEEQIDAMFDAIRTRFAGHEASLHFIDKDFGLSNASIDPKMEELRQTITKVAKQQSYWGELKPAKWIHLEKMLDNLRRNGVQVIKRTTLEQLKSALPVPITSDEELDLFLRFQHEIGTTLYFSIPELRDQIVLSPQFLVDALKSLITAEMFCKKKPEIFDKWRDFRHKGILTMSLLDAVWKQGNQFFHENREHLLNLMEHLNVIARPISFVENEDRIDSTKTQKQDFYLAPCMLKNPPPHSLLEPDNKYISTPCFCLNMGNIAFPSAIFNRLLVSCISQWPIARSGEKHQIYCGCCQFDIDIQHRLTLTFACNTVQLRITRYSKTDRHPSANLCKSVLAIVKGNLRRICDFLSLVVDLDEFVKCPAPADRFESSDCLHSVKKIRECQEFPCHHHNDVAVLCSSDLLKYWIEKDTVNSSSENSHDNYSDDVARCAPADVVSLESAVIGDQCLGAVGGTDPGGIDDSTDGVGDEGGVSFIENASEDDDSAEDQEYNVDINIGPFTQEHMNYARLCNVIVTLGADALRDVLVTQVPKPYTDIYRALLGNRTAKRGMKQIRREQLRLIFQDPQYRYTGTVDQFDITLLYTLIRNISSCPAPATGWGEQPDDQPRDGSLGASVERIRLMRNKVSGHSADGKLVDQAYEDHMADISQILDDIEVVLGDRGYKDVLEKCRKQIITTQEAKSLRKKFENYKQQIRAMVESVKEKVDQLSTAIDQNI